MVFDNIYRKFSFDIKNKIIDNYLWIEHDEMDFERINLVKGDKINFIFSDFICSRCHKKINYSTIGICIECSSLETDFNTRLECIFNKENAMIHKGCTKSNPVCNISENTKYCFQKYVVYLGRLGNKIKIGISRKNRKGGYIHRLIEQGLQEAIVIDSISSLPEAVIVETWFKNIGIDDKIKFNTKLYEFNHPNIIDKCIECFHEFDDTLELNVNAHDLINIFPYSLIKEKFPNNHIIHYSLYPEFNFKQKIYSGRNTLKGQIIHIQGSLVVIRDNSHLYLFDLKKYENRLIIGD